MILYSCTYSCTLLKFGLPCRCHCILESCILQDWTKIAGCFFFPQTPLFATFINKTRSTVHVLKKKDSWYLQFLGILNTVHCYCLTNKLQIPCLRLVEMCSVNWIFPTCMYCCTYTPHPSSRATRKPAARKSIYLEC